MKSTYAQAGVDIDRGNEFVERIKPFVAGTTRSGVMGSIGGFGGMFALDINTYKHPVLVSGTDGVGTKLKLAIEMDRFDTIGQDLVAMCVNDIACSGAQPLFFLDYFATGRLEPARHAGIVKGIADACKSCRCALIGGETAEMPGIYAGTDFDLAGFAVGVVEKDEIIDGHAVGLGDAVIGISSSGFHSNGFALVRSVIANAELDVRATPLGFNAPLGETLLAPTYLYSPIIGRLKESFELRAIAHITGGGIIENLPRVLPNSVQAVIDTTAWEIPPIMRYIQELGHIDRDEMLRVFNCGIGMVMVVPRSQAESICEEIGRHGMRAHIIGSVEKRRGTDGVAFS